MAVRIQSKKPKSAKGRAKGMTRLVVNSSTVNLSFVNGIGIREPCWCTLKNVGLIIPSYTSRNGFCISVASGRGDIDIPNFKGRQEGLNISNEMSEQRKGLRFVQSFLNTIREAFKQSFPEAHVL